MIKEEGIPEYLKKGWEESRWRRALRFRMGNEIGENNYWEEEDKRICRLCEGETETWEHVWERWRTGGRAGRKWRGGGEGEWWMKQIEREREVRKDRGRRGGRGAEEERE